MKVLIACEESQSVCKEFRKLGFDAYSCDVQECSGGHPEWHIKDDVLKVMHMGWDCMIAFPPCTHLAVSGAAWFEQKKTDGRQQQGIDFFMHMINAPIKHIAVENPIGIMSKKYRQPDQIVHPFYWGDPVKKSTCLWLKNLPLLYHVKTVNLFDSCITHVPPELIRYNSKKSLKGFRLYSGAAAKWYRSAEERSRERSKTFPGIAKAMAMQWGEYLKQSNA